MINVCSGLKASFIVLELLRNDEELKDLEVYVECFQNCREMGLTFTIYGEDSRTYCVYEHRNSDSIIVNHKDKWFSAGGNLPYQADDKYTYDAKFQYDEYYKCYEYLKAQIVKFAEVKK